MRRETLGHPPKPRIWTALFICVTLINLFICCIGQGNMAGTPLYVQQSGAPNSYSGILIAVFVLMAIIGRMISGNIIDKHTRRSVAVAGGCIIFAGSLIPLFFSSLEAQLPARILEGFGFAITHTAISTCAADILPRKRLGEGLGYYSLGQAVAMAVGPSMALWLTGVDHPESLQIGFGCLGLIILGLSLFVRYEKNPLSLPEDSSYRVLKGKREQDEDARASFEESDVKVAPKMKDSFVKRVFEKSALGGAIPFFFSSITLTVFVSYTALYANYLEYTNPSAFFLIAAIVAVLIRFGASSIFDHMKPLRVLIIPIVGGTLTLLSVLFIHNEFVYYLCGAGYGICLGFSVPLFNSVAIKASPPERFGAATALLFIMNDAGVGIGALLWGAILDSFGFSAVFLGGVICLGASYVAAAFLFPREPESSAPSIQ